MKNFDKRNLVYFAAQEAWERYGDHLEGLLAGPVCVVSERILPEQAKRALDASAAQLGYGEHALTYITLWPQSDAAASNERAVTEADRTSMGNGAGEEASANARPTSLKNGAGEQAAAGSEQKGVVATRPLSGRQLFGLVESIDPLVVIAADAQSMATLSRAYQADMPRDAVARLLGRNAVGFVDFPAMLSDNASKQKAWGHLKRLGTKPKPR